MKRNLMLANVAIAIVVAVVFVYLRKEWTAERHKEQVVETAKVKPPAPPPVAPLTKVQPIAGLEYADIAAKNLFSKDRNAIPIPDPPAPPPAAKPMPPLPSAHGVMLWDGEPPTIVLSEHGSPEQKGYHPGDTIGAFKIAAIDNKSVVFEWEGKEVRKRLDEIMDQTPLVADVAPPPQETAPSQAPPKPKSLSSEATNGPGVDTGGGFRACNPGDTSPAGAVVNGYKKVAGQTPFGSSCHWEAVQ